jgi:EAL domain-containing protein (putative c-di-GMP-specific phosphodiesterase class I)
MKLDGSFVAEVEWNEHPVSILRSHAALGATLDTPVLIEGIERPTQLAIAACEGRSAVQASWSAEVHAS